ncbi:MAG: tetratricopeptide repeat protein [Myxococcaceae bacterium]
MGRILKNSEMNVNAINETTAKLKAYARGEMTWAEVEGITFEEAKAIAQVGCDLAGAGRLEEARIIFEGLVEMNPKDSAARAALGTVYQKLGRSDEAMVEYSASLAQDPRNPVALANRGELRLKAGDRNGFTDLAMAIDSDPHGETAAGRRAKGLLKAIAMAAVEQVKTQSP